MKVGLRSWLCVCYLCLLLNKHHDLEIISIIISSLVIGSFLVGVRSGQGSMQYFGGDHYLGNWVGNSRSGQGRMVYGDTGES